MSKSTIYKIIIAIAILIFGGFLFLGFFSYHQSKENTSSIMLDIQKQQLHSNQLYIDNLLTQTHIALQNLSQQLTPSILTNQPLLQMLINSYYSTTKLVNIQIGFQKDGRLLSSNILDTKLILKTFKNDAVDARKYQWYELATKNKEGYIGEVYHNQTLQEKVVIFSIPIYYNKKIIAILKAELPLREIQKELNQNKPSIHSYSFLIDERNMFIVHPNTQILLRNHISIDYLVGIYEQLHNQQSLNYLLSDNYLSCSKIQQTKWLLCSLLPQKDFKTLKNTSIQIIGIICSFVFILLVLLVLLARKVYLLPYSNTFQRNTFEQTTQTLQKLQTKIQQISQHSTEIQTNSKNIDQIIEKASLLILNANIKLTKTNHNDQSLAKLIVQIQDLLNQAQEELNKTQSHTTTLLEYSKEPKK